MAETWSNEAPTPSQIVQETTTPNMIKRKNTIRFLHLVWSSAVFAVRPRPRSDGASSATVQAGRRLVKQNKLARAHNTLKLSLHTPHPLQACKLSFILPHGIRRWGGSRTHDMSPSSRKDMMKNHAYLWQMYGYF